MIPLFNVFMAPDVADFVLPVLHSGYIGEGKKTQEFERQVGEFIGNPHVVAVNSGTSAIQMALRLAGVRHGSKVITTPMTCLATNMAILALGAVPVWADILPDGTIDPDDVAAKMDCRPDAVVCVDWGGLPCRLDELKGLGVPVIEDACQSLGSRYKGQYVGSDADFVCFSFQAIKHISTADGGALVVNDNPGALDDARLMRWFGLDRTKSASMRCEQDPPLWGYKMQMNDVAASIGLANIRHLPSILETVRRHAERYNAAFAHLAKVRLSEPIGDERQSGYWLYTVLVDDAVAFTRYMAHNGVEVSKAHTRNDTKGVFAPFRASLPGVSIFDFHHVCIPVGWWLTDEDVENIVSLVTNY